MINTKNNRLTAISEAYKIEGKGYTKFVDVLCDCGVQLTVRVQSFKSGSTKSCGCLQREKASELKTEIIGNKFSRLLVIEDLGVISRRRMVKALCDCGTTLEVRYDLISNLTTKSCGCLYKEDRGVYARTHGLTGTPTYKSWQSMKDRCSNPDASGFENYGGRGITFDPRWDKFEEFYTDMGERPEGFELDRIDNELGYSKENCKWSDSTDQSFNRRKRQGTSSKYIGVYYNKEKNKWDARLYKYKVKVFYGRFNTEEEAAKAYDDACFEHYGVRKNFI